MHNAEHVNRKHKEKPHNLTQFCVDCTGISAKTYHSECMVTIMAALVDKVVWCSSWEVDYVDYTASGTAGTFKVKCLHAELEAFFGSVKVKDFTIAKVGFALCPLPSAFLCNKFCLVFFTTIPSTGMHVRLRPAPSVCRLVLVTTQKMNHWTSTCAKHISCHKRQLSVNNTLQSTRLRCLQCATCAAG